MNNHIRINPSLGSNNIRKHQTCKQQGTSTNGWACALVRAPPPVSVQNMFRLRLFVFLLFSRQNSGGQFPYLVKPNAVMVGRTKCLMSKATRTKILKIALELNYIRNDSITKSLHTFPIMCNHKTNHARIGSHGKRLAYFSSSRIASTQSLM